MIYTPQVTGRRDRAKPLPFKMDSRGPWGFAGANEGNPQISAKFVAPCYYMNKYDQWMSFALEVHACLAKLAVPSLCSF